MLKTKEEKEKTPDGNAPIFAIAIIGALLRIDGGKYQEHVIWGRFLELVVYFAATMAIIVFGWLGGW